MAYAKICSDNIAKKKWSKISYEFELPLRKHLWKQSQEMMFVNQVQNGCRVVKLPWIFPGAPLGSRKYPG